MTTDRILEEPCEVTSLMHGFEAERRGRLLRLGNQLQLLPQGVGVWNAWRKEHPDVPIDLACAYLTDFKLSGIDFRNADLDWAELTACDLRGADFRNASMSRTDLFLAHCRGADFSGANLTETNFHYCDLREANFTHAILMETCFVKAWLMRATLRDSDVNQAGFDGSDLRGVDLTGVPYDETAPGLILGDIGDEAFEVDVFAFPDREKGWDIKPAG